MHKPAFVLILALPSCLAAPPAPPAPGAGELEGLTLAEAAERLSKSAPALTDCETECLSFATEGCSEISDQCDTGDHALAGPYVAECAIAKRLACGHFRDVQDCQSACKLIGAR